MRMRNTDKYRCALQKAKELKFPNYELPHKELYAILEDKGYRWWKSAIIWILPGKITEDDYIRISGYSESHIHDIGERIREKLITDGLILKDTTSVEKEDVPGYHGKKTYFRKYLVFDVFSPNYNQSSPKI